MVDGYYVPIGTLRLKDYNGTGWYCGFYKGPLIFDALKDDAGWPWGEYEDESLKYGNKKLLVDLKVLMW